ncbi:hypothetical protein D8770_02825 [Methylobacterium sp. DB1607]|nr:hypothetical protein [Methylobacterium sp. DB1607]
MGRGRPKATSSYCPEHGIGLIRAGLLLVAAMDALVTIFLQATIIRMLNRALMRTSRFFRSILISIAGVVSLRMLVRLSHEAVL